MARRKAGTVVSTALTGIRFELDSQGRPTFQGMHFEFTAQVLDSFGRERPMVSERLPENVLEIGHALKAFVGLTSGEADLMGVLFNPPPEPQA